MEETGTQLRGMERLVSGVLIVGVAFSLALLLVGSVLLFARGDSGYGQATTRTAALVRAAPVGTAPAYPHTVPGVLAGVAAGRAYAFVCLGLLALIATPVVLVGLALVGFIRARDRAYIAIAAAVLGILLLSFVLGKA